jgi:hypothetical protein
LVQHAAAPGPRVDQISWHPPQDDDPYSGLPILTQESKSGFNDDGTAFNDMDRRLATGRERLDISRMEMRCPIEDRLIEPIPRPF